MGDQVKQTFQKLKAFWTALSPKIKKLFIFGFIGLLVLAVALTVFLNTRVAEYTVLFPNLESAKIADTMQKVRDSGHVIQQNKEGKMEVLSSEYDMIIAQLAMDLYPKSVLGYEQYDKASGLTATDADKRQYNIQQAQDRLQDTIRNYGGVSNVVVTLSLPQENAKIWEKSTQKGSANVSIIFEDDVKFSPQQVSAVKWAVASAVEGVLPEDVVVTDARRSLVLKGVDQDDETGMDAMSDRVKLETMLEEKMEEKARKLLSVILEPGDMEVACTVKLDYDKVKEETKTYLPSEQSTNNSGVLQHADSRTSSGTSGPAEGVPGEDPNTDLPTYNNQTTDNGGYSESQSSADYLVGHMLKQVEKDPAKYSDASISVALKKDIDDAARESMVQNVAMATNIPVEKISIVSYGIEEIAPDVPEEPKWWQDTQLVLVVGIGALVLVLLIIIILVLLGKARKHRQQEEVLEAATADVIELQGEDDTEVNLQQELEERKRQLLESSAKTADEAIADEVRDFAKSNPEITANLLRAWMKEEID